MRSILIALSLLFAVPSLAGEVPNQLPDSTPPEVAPLVALSFTPISIPRLARPRRFTLAFENVHGTYGPTYGIGLEVSPFAFSGAYGRRHLGPQLWSALSGLRLSVAVHDNRPVQSNEDGAIFGARWSWSLEAPRAEQLLQDCAEAVSDASVERCSLFAQASSLALTGLEVGGTGAYSPEQEGIGAFRSAWLSLGWGRNTFSAPQPHSIEEWNSVVNDDALMGRSTHALGLQTQLVALWRCNNQQFCVDQNPQVRLPNQNLRLLARVELRWLWGTVSLDGGVAFLPLLPNDTTNLSRAVNAPLAVGGSLRLGRSVWWVYSIGGDFIDSTNRFFVQNSIVWSP